MLQGEQVFLAINMLFWTTLYLVKASFLALSWSIFSVSRKFRLAWRIITVYTFITFWPVFLSTLWQCGQPSQFADTQACSDADSDGVEQQFLVRTAAISVSLHISSDCLILALPIKMIWNMHLAKDQKIGITAVFAVTVIDIILGTIRNIAYLTTGLGSVESNSNNPGSNTIISDLLLIGEPCIAVMVCAVPTYRVLLPSSRRRRKNVAELQRTSADPGQTTLNTSGQTLETEIELVARRNAAPVA